MQIIHFSRLQRHFLWFLTISIIILLSVFGRKLQALIVTKIDSYWIAVSVFFILFCIVLYLFLQRENNGLSRRSLAALALLVLIGCIGVSSKYLLPVEAIHFLLFSWFGWLSAAVYGTVSAVIAVVSISVGDEILQHFLPDRVGDLRDIVINVVSGFAGLLLNKK